MDDILKKLAICIERGKEKKDSPYPPDLKGQVGVWELTKEALESGFTPDQILQQGMVTSNHNANEWMFAPQTLFNIQPAFMETLLLSQITSEILCLRRKHKL